MSETITIQLPDTVAQKVKEIAAFTGSRIEDILLELIDRASSELVIESLPDNQVLTLCNLQMENQQQELLTELLARQREGQLNDNENTQLDELMQIYRQGLVRKAKAVKVAVERGIIPPIN
jgi:predicted transcriptional regulator